MPASTTQQAAIVRVNPAAVPIALRVFGEERLALWSKRQLACRLVGLASRKHGLTETAEYRCWASMKSRCSNLKDPAFPKYGGRGITVCNRWRPSFEAFLADMGNRPGPEYSIDRIDNDGPYDPANCRWANRSTQQRNKRNARLVKWEGRMVSLAALCDERGLCWQTVKERLDRGLSAEDALASNNP